MRYHDSLHQSVLAKKNLPQTCLNDSNFHPLPIILTGSKKTSLKYISVKFVWRPNILPLKTVFSKIDISLFLNVCSALSNCWIQRRENKHLQKRIYFLIFLVIVKITVTEPSFRFVKQNFLVKR